MTTHTLHTFSNDDVSIVVDFVTVDSRNGFPPLDEAAFIFSRIQHTEPRPASDHFLHVFAALKKAGGRPETAKALTARGDTQFTTFLFMERGNADAKELAR